MSDLPRGSQNSGRRFHASLAAGVFLLVLGAQLWLVARAGTDGPILDQWDVEGGWLYPGWRDGTLGLADLLRPHNEHRIGWTHLLNLALFTANGQWDPLTQMVAGAFVRATAAAGLAVWLGRAAEQRRGRLLIALGVCVACLPHLGWHNVLWGFQSHVWFSLLFSLLAFALLGEPGISARRRFAGMLAGVAAMFAMGAGSLTPLPLLGLAAVRAFERRAWDRARWREAWPALALALAAWQLSRHGVEPAPLQPTSVGDFFTAFGRMLAWPHVDEPFAALALNLPLAWTVGERLIRRRVAAPGEDFILALGGWALAVGAAAAWARGGGGELAAGVPSRYVDFIVLLPLANALCLPGLLARATERARVITRSLVIVWAVFLGIGWLGLSLQMTRRILLPRMRDQAAPVRLLQAFQRTGDAAVFDGQPRLLVPHTNLDVVRAVLADPRMRGVLPPSLQPDLKPGPLSRGVRVVLGIQIEPARNQRAPVRAQ
ncbi:MAG: hypothetical protein RIQ93_374 [Verrucomicrobiota bacterium]|jgi:hypothetical protein